MASAGKRKLLIDTDAGIDDAQAILMAITNPDVDVLGITCVAGNVDADQVARNVLRVLHVVDRLDIPVYIGCNKSLLGDEKLQDGYHGTDGFGDAYDPNAPVDNIIQSEHAVTALLRMTKDLNGEVSLVCIGPLTNIAMVIRMDATFGSRLKHCYIMGGNHLGKGNITVSAEFNFYSDPEAAYVVLNQLLAPITMVTWETCMAHTLSWDWFQRFHNDESTIGRFLSSINKNVVKKVNQRFIDDGVDRIHEMADQYAVAAAIFDDVIIEKLSVFATVEIKSSLTTGQLVVDWSNILHKKHNVTLVTKVNTLAMMTHLDSLLQK